MDPISATATASLSLYQAGGLVLVLIVLGIVGVSLMARWFMGMVKDLGLKLDDLFIAEKNFYDALVAEVTVD